MYCKYCTDFEMIVHPPEGSTRYVNKTSPAQAKHRRLHEVPRLVKDMISVPPDALSFEQLWKSHILWHLLFRDIIACALRRANDEFADLCNSQSSSQI